MKNRVLAFVSVVLMTMGSVAFAEARPPMPAPMPLPPPAPAPGSVQAAPPGRPVSPVEVQTDCAEAVQVSGCKQLVGRSLIKCFMKYQQAHPDFKVAAQCSRERRARPPVKK